MRLSTVLIENFRAIDRLDLPLDTRLNVLVGENAAGKTSVIEAIAVGLGAILAYLPESKGRGFQKSDLRTTFSPRVPARVLFGPTEPGDRFPALCASLPYVRVALAAESGVKWDRMQRRDKTGKTTSQVPKAIGVTQLNQYLDPIVESVRGGGDLALPILAYYGTDRAVPDIPQRQRGFRKQLGRFAALDGALEAGFRFKDIFEWFVEQEDIERRGKEAHQDFSFRLPILEAVRTAVGRSLPGCKNPRTELHPLRLAVDMDTPEGGPELLALDQLSGGYRIMLALVIDLARRMAQANPQLGAGAIDAAGVVLIDEVDLHLHPRWQQRVLPDLLRTFPYIQFIVSTHSPQVLTSVQPEQILILDRQSSRVTAESVASSYGAESGRLLQEIFGVDQRPPGAINEFSDTLSRYAELVSGDRGEEPEALALRRRLDELSPQDPGLIRLDMEIRRRRVLRRAQGDAG